MGCTWYIEETGPPGAHSPMRAEAGAGPAFSGGQGGRWSPAAAVWAQLGSLSSEKFIPHTGQSLHSTHPLHESIVPLLARLSAVCVSCCAHEAREFSFLWIMVFHAMWQPWQALS